MRINNILNGPAITIPETLALACTFSVDGITMLSLGLSIQLVLKKKTRERIKRIKKIAAVLVFLFLSVSIVFCSIYDGDQVHHRVRLAVDSSVLTVNMIILIFLVKQLKLLDKSVKRAVKSVYK